MSTSDYISLLISLLALMVAVVSGLANYFYTKRQLQLMTTPILDGELSLSQKSAGSKPIATGSEEHGEYYRYYDTSLILRMRNMSSSLSIAQIAMKLEYGQHISWFLPFWHRVPLITHIEKKTLTPLEESQSHLTFALEDLVKIIFPEHLQLTLATEKDRGKYGYYTERKHLSFPLRLTLRHQAGVPNAPIVTTYKEYYLSSMSTPSLQEGSVMWVLSPKRTIYFDRHDWWYNY